MLLITGALLQVEPDSGESVARPAFQSKWPQGTQSQSKDWTQPNCYQLVDKQRPSNHRIKLNRITASTPLCNVFDCILRIFVRSRSSDSQCRYRPIALTAQQRLSRSEHAPHNAINYFTHKLTITVFKVKLFIVQNREFDNLPTIFRHAHFLRSARFLGKTCDDLKSRLRICVSFT